MQSLCGSFYTDFHVQNYGSDWFPASLDNAGKLTHYKQFINVAALSPQNNYQLILLKRLMFCNVTDFELEITLGAHFPISHLNTCGELLNNISSRAMDPWHQDPSTNFSNTVIRRLRRNLEKSLTECVEASSNYLTDKEALNAYLVYSHYVYIIEIISLIVSHLPSLKTLTLTIPELPHPLVMLTDLILKRAGLVTQINFMPIWFLNPDNGDLSSHSLFSGHCMVGAKPTVDQGLCYGNNPGFLHNPILRDYLLHLEFIHPFIQSC